MTTAADQNTDEMNGKRPFEDRVFARFDAIDARLNGVDARFDTVDSSIGNLDVRLQKLEVRAYDTKPIWEQALKEIVDTRRELTKRLDRIEVRFKLDAHLEGGIVSVLTLG